MAPFPKWTRGADDLGYLCYNPIKAFPYKKHSKINSNDLQMTLNDLQMTLVAKISVPLVLTRQMALNGPKHIYTSLNLKMSNFIFFIIYDTQKL